ncbi:hypothetical protein [Acidiplasma sp.]|uniref:hypothetical protein n=1 Tax=Acidiplasma sp. TaxID=1872114 RepID=UPI0025873DB8|nr:hypothetical protein [Acidiplasma sp.]
MRKIFMIIILIITLLILVSGNFLNINNIDNKINEDQTAQNINVFSGNSSDPYIYFNGTVDNSTSFNYGLSWNTSKYFASTENSILIYQNNVTLLNITYGKYDYCATVVNADKKYSNLFSLKRENHWYNITFIFSPYSSYCAYIIINSSHEISIPYKIMLKYPVKNGRIVIAFGGPRSTQKIINYGERPFNNLIYFNNHSLKLNKYSYSLIYNGTSSYSAVFNGYYGELLYVHNKSIVGYNIYNKTSHIIYSLNNNYTNISYVIQNQKYYIFVSQNNINLNLIKICKNGTFAGTLKIKKLFSGYIYFYDGYYIYYGFNHMEVFKNESLLKTYEFNGIITYLMLSGDNLRFNVLNRTVINEYEFNNSMVPAEYKVLNLSRAVNATVLNYYGNRFSIIHNGTEMLGAGKILNGFYPLPENYFIDSKNIYYCENGTLLNTGIKNTGYFSFQKGIIINFYHNYAFIYDSSTIQKPNKFYVSMNYNISGKILHLHYHIHGIYRHYLAFINIKNSSIIIHAGKNFNISYEVNYNGLYIMNLTLIDPQGIREYYSTSVGINSFPVIKTMDIAQRGNSVIAIINGENINNVTFKWYVNGRFYGSGTQINNLPDGIDHVELTAYYNGHYKNITETYLILGNIPYYTAAAGIIILLIIFSYNMVFNNKNIEELIMKYDKKMLREILHESRKLRIKKHLLMKKLREMEGSGKISLEKDMDKNIYIIKK